MAKKVLAFTAIRSDYDLLSGVYKLLNKDTAIDFRLLVSGAHLSRVFGYTVTEIEKDGLDILLRIESLLNSDSPQSRIKSGSLLLQNAIDVVASFAPDLIIVCGDREDVLIGSTIGAYLGIEVMHFFGGDQSEHGFVDNKVRRATSMLSDYHMVTLNSHRDRLIAMGIPAGRIVVIGNPALDRFTTSGTYSRGQLAQKFGSDMIDNDYALVIFHPFAEEDYSITEQISNLVSALKQSRLKIFISYPNVDPGNEEIISAIAQLAHEPGFYVYENLSRNEFISLYKNASVIIGNSSSGILEAATVRLPVVDIGKRQLGRERGANVIECDCSKKAIITAINAACADEFRQSIAEIENLYGDGHSSHRAYQQIIAVLHSQ